MQFFELIQNEKENVQFDFCGDCFIKKEKRSKHCDICKRCINNFDHHCYYIDNCIGKKNLKIFAIFIFYLTFSIFLQILFQFFILFKILDYKSKFDILFLFIKNDDVLISVHYGIIVVFLLISIFFLISCL